MNEIFRRKKELRTRLESRRRGLSQEWVAEKSQLIVQKLQELPEFKEADCIHTYVSWRNEVDTHDFMRATLKGGKHVVVPVIDLTHHILLHAEIRDFSDLRAGTFGILEPHPDRLVAADPTKVDLIIVPGVAFDLSGHRLGFGGGYYDDFLKQMTTTKIGLAYQFQIVEKVPTRHQDERVDMVITEEEVYRIAG